MTVLITPTHVVTEAGVVVPPVHVVLLVAPATADHRAVPLDALTTEVTLPDDRPGLVPDGLILFQHVPLSLQHQKCWGRLSTIKKLMFQSIFHNSSINPSLMETQTYKYNSRDAVASERVRGRVSACWWRCTWHTSPPLGHRTESTQSGHRRSLEGGAENK